MMRWKDLPIRKRLLAANYLMILTPVLCFMLLSVGIFWIFGMENLNRSSGLILYLAGKRPHPVHPVRTDPAPGPVGPL